MSAPCAKDLVHGEYKREDDRQTSRLKYGSQQGSGLPCCPGVGRLGARLPAPLASQRPDRKLLDPGDLNHFTPWAGNHVPQFADIGLTHTRSQIAATVSAACAGIKFTTAPRGCPHARDNVDCRRTRRAQRGSIRYSATGSSDLGRWAASSLLVNGQYASPSRASSSLLRVSALDLFR